MDLRDPYSNPETFARLRDLYDRAQELDTSEFDVFIDAECGDDVALKQGLRQLLDVEDSESLSKAAWMAAHAEYRLLTEFPSSTIGSYRLLGVLGSGGMGVVYEAEQSGLDRRVALKVVRPELVGEGAVRRFEFESRMLARLKNPGIAQVIEAGWFESPVGRRPYLAMELVEGRDILSYAETAQLGDKDRLRLIETVARIIQWAHQRMVVHRDLKPANVLVEVDGSPKILDFGVACLLEPDPDAPSLTVTGQVVGTVAYASPDLIRGESTSDVRLDVYSLGVIAYQLLPGRLPHDLTGVSLPESTRIICEHEPDRPTRWRPELKGDVEAIILKAIDRDPDQRYPSADALAEDIRAYLDHRPVVARSPSPAYQLRKFIRRHRTGSVAAFITLTTAVVAVVAVLHFAFVASLEAQKATQVRTTILNIFAAIADTGDQDPETLRAMVDHAAQEIEVELDSQPLVQADLQFLLGTIYIGFGKAESGVPLLERCVETRRREGAPIERVVAALDRLATAYHGTGQQLQAARCRREIAQLSESWPLLSPGAQIRNAIEAAVSVGKSGQYLQAFHELEEIGRLLDQRYPAAQALRLQLDTQLGAMLYRYGRFAEAEVVLRRTLEPRVPFVQWGCRASAGSGTMEVAALSFERDDGAALEYRPPADPRRGGWVLDGLGHEARAEASRGAEAAWVIRDESSGTSLFYEQMAPRLDPTRSGWTMRARIRARDGVPGVPMGVRYVDETRGWDVWVGVERGTQVVSLSAEIGSHRVHTIRDHGFHDYALVFDPDSGTATLSVDGECVAESYAGIPTPHRTQEFWNGWQLAFLLSDSGRYREALKELERCESVHAARRLTRENHEGAYLPFLRGHLLCILGEWDAAERNIERSLEVYSELRIQGASFARRELGHLHLARGRFAESAATYREALEGQLALAEAEPRHDAQARSNLSRALLALGKYPEARALAERGRREAEVALHPEHPDVAEALAVEARARMHAGDFEGAGDVLGRAFVLRTSLFGSENVLLAELHSLWGEIRVEQTRWAEARTELGRARELLDLCLPPDHSQVLRVERLLAECQIAEQPERALNRLLKVEEASGVSLGSEHPELAHCARALARVLGDLDRREEARAWLARALELQTRALGTEHPETVWTRGLVLISDDRDPDPRALQSCLEVLTATQEGHPRVTLLREWLTN